MKKYIFVLISILMCGCYSEAVDSKINGYDPGPVTVISKQFRIEQDDPTYNSCSILVRGNYQGKVYIQSFKIELIGRWGSYCNIPLNQDIRTFIPEQKDSVLIVKPVQNNSSMNFPIF